MTHSLRRLSLVLAATIGSATFVLADGPTKQDENWETALLKRAATIRPTADELRWQTIPWVATPEEAIRLAKAEKRPIFVFTVDGNPFDRC